MIAAKTPLLRQELEVAMKNVRLGRLLDTAERVRDVYQLSSSARLALAPSVAHHAVARFAEAR